MRWAVGGAIVFAAVAAGIAIWAAKDDESPATAPADLRLGDLEPALLREQDISEEGFSDTNSFPRDPSDGWPGLSRECRELADLHGANIGAGADELRANFGRDDAGVSHALSLIGEDDLSIAELGAAMQDCGAMSEEGNPFSLRFDPEPVEGLGEEALAARVEMGDPSEGWSTGGYVVLSQRDGVLSSVFMTASVDPVTSQGVQLDEEVVRRMAEEADDKVRRVLEARSL